MGSPDSSKPGTVDSSLRRAPVPSELSVHLVGLAEEEQCDGSRHHHDHGTRDQAEKKIGEGGSHSDRAGTKPWNQGNSDLRDRWRLSTMLIPLL